MDGKAIVSARGTCWTPPMGTTRDEATRHRLLREAAYEFARLGYEAASLRKIAERVGIRAATVYSHFPGGKAQLYEDILGTVSSLLLELDTNPTRYATIRGALTELCPPTGGKFNARSVGNRFKHFRERVIGDLCLVNRGKGEGGQVWAVVKASQYRSEQEAAND